MGRHRGGGENPASKTARKMKTGTPGIRPEKKTMTGTGARGTQKSAPVRTSKKGNGGWAESISS